MENRKETDAVQKPKQTDAVRQKSQPTGENHPPKEPETELTDVMPPL